MFETKIWTNQNLKNKFPYLNYNLNKVSKEQLYKFQSAYLTSMKLYKGMAQKTFDRVKKENKTDIMGKTDK